MVVARHFSGGLPYERIRVPPGTPETNSQHHGYVSAVPTGRELFAMPPATEVASYYQASLRDARLEGRGRPSQRGRDEATALFFCSHRC